MRIARPTDIDSPASRMLPASFRGVAFYVESAEDTLGARVIVHEFPGRKDVYPEPNGVSAKRFTVDAHLIGPDFQKQLELLEAALEEEGPGKLVHPYRGEKLVSLVEPVHIKQSTREGGMARLSMVFVEAGVVSSPTLTVDTSSLVKKTSSILLATASLDKLDLTGPNFLQDAANAILNGPRGLTNKLNLVHAQVSSAFAIVDQISVAIDDFSAAVGSLLRLPKSLALKIQNLINSLFTAVTSVSPFVTPSRGDTQRNSAKVVATTSYLSVLGTFSDTLAPVTGNTVSRRKERLNQQVLGDFIDVTGLANGINALTDLPLDNSDQATDLLEKVDTLITTIQDRGTLEDDVDQALRDLRAAFFAHLRRQTIDLTGLGHFTPLVTQPALLIAWQLYGDAQRDAEIIERNGIEHPGFVAGGVPIAVSNV